MTGSSDPSKVSATTNQPSSSNVDLEKGAPPQNRPKSPPKDDSRPSSSGTGIATDDEDHHDQDDEDRRSSADDNQPDGPRLSLKKSATPSAKSTTPIVVTRRRRRGLFAILTIVPEVTRPYDYSSRTKWMITSTVAMAGSVAPMGSGIFYPALNQMTADLHTTPTIVNLTVAMYMLAMAIAPLWWSSFSERFGRRTIYVISFALFIVFSVVSALSHSIVMLVVMRTLGGGASASVQSLGAGTIADIWEPRERGRAMSMFYLGPLMGPLLAPILGGILSQEFGWQATMWFLSIYGGVIFLALLLLLPETLSRDKLPPPPERKPAAAAADDTTAATPDVNGNNNTLTPALSRTRTAASSVHKTTKRAASLFHQLIIDPLSVLLFLRFPPVLVTVYYAAITFGTLFVLNISMQDAYSKPDGRYAFSPSVVGLMYIAPSLGYLVSAAVGGRWIDSIMAREARRAERYDEKGNLVYLPEDRMRENAWLAGTVYPAALIFYGWTIQNQLYWFVPLIGAFFFGLASMLVFSAATTMLTEFVRRRSSSGVAVNNLVRNLLSCTGAVTAQPLIDSLGAGWLFTILGLFTWITGYMCIWAMKRYGPHWRKSMDLKLGN